MRFVSLGCRHILVRFFLCVGGGNQNTKKKSRAPNFALVRRSNMLQDRKGEANEALNALYCRQSLDRPCSHFHRRFRWRWRFRRRRQTMFSGDFFPSSIYVETLCVCSSVHLRLVFPWSVDAHGAGQRLEITRKGTNKHWTKKNHVQPVHKTMDG